MNHQVYVVTQDGRPVAVRWELLSAMACIPEHELPTTDIRQSGQNGRQWVVTYRDEKYLDGVWRIARVDTYPYEPRD